ncbi:MAG: ABC transporter permease [Chloroflexi bacterium]|nr:ABC transporter permease [Chloroflexota bacterium]
MSQVSTIAPAAEDLRFQRSRWDFLYLASRSRLVVIGALICLPIFILAIVGPSISPYDPLSINVLDKLAPPSERHWMGADNLGRDILSRVIFGARVSLEVGTVSVILGLVAGVALGAISGYIGGWLDSLLMRLMDAIQAFPAMLLALVLVAILGPGLFTVMTAVAGIRIPVFARTVRASVLAERQKDYIEAARCLGQREEAILFRHILPNIISPIIVLGTSYFATAIVVEASLSFLGLGVVPPDVSWGTMLSESRQYMERYPWAPLFPGLAISLAVLGFNLLGDGVRDLLDPRLRTIL